MRRIGGFTLIELVTCIVIMAVLAAITAPRFFDTQPFAERGYSAEVAGALRAARQVAVASACEVQVTLNPAAGYQALQRAAAGNTCNPVGGWTTPVRLTDGRLLAGTPPSNATVSAAATIVFGAQGQVTSGAPPSIVVGAFTITVDPVSGFVKP